jgi:hypothetical protein
LQGTIGSETVAASIAGVFGSEVDGGGVLFASFVPWSESVGAVSFFVGGEREIDWKKNKANARMNSNVPPTPRAARTPVQPRTFRHPIVVFAFVLGIDLYLLWGFGFFLSLVR